MRSIVLAVLVVFTGCRSAGGKVFGPISLASAIGAGYLLSTSGASIEGHTLVQHEDHRDMGGALLITAVLAAGGWAFCEFMERDPTFGGAYGVLAGMPAAAPVEPAPIEPAPVVPVDPGEPAQQNAPRLRDWRFDPSDGQHRLYAPNGEYMGRLDASGDVWDASGVTRGRVAITPSCALACRRPQAARMLLGIPMHR